MEKKKAKLEMETLGKILLLTAFLVIFLLLFKGCQDSFEDVGIVGMKEYMCWGSNMINAEVLRFFPTTCSPTMIEPEEDEEFKEEKISDLIRKCWWMYGKGAMDIKDIKGMGITKEALTKSVDQAHICYSFRPTEDISLVKLREYMSTHKTGGKEAELEESTWAYLQEGTMIEDKRNVICFDKKKFVEAKGKLKANKNYYIIFYDDRGVGGEGIRDRIMISPNSNFGEGLTGIKGWIIGLFLEKCYDIEKEAEEQKEAEDITNKALKVFEEASSKFKKCYETKITESCMCDDSEIDVRELPVEFEIRIEKKAPMKYNLVLYDRTKKENVKEESFDVNIGFMSKAEDDIKTTMKELVVTIPSKLKYLCTEGLGLEGSRSLPPVFSLFYNIDSRFYLNPPVSEALFRLEGDQMQSVCTDIQHDTSGTYKGIYLLSHSRKQTQATSREVEYYLDPTKIPVLKYCSGKLVSEEAEEELKRRELEEEKKLCESYKREECLAHLDKCYPNFLEPDTFISCNYCEEDFKCESLLTKTACELNPCSKTCEWEKVGILGACFEKK